MNTLFSIPPPYPPGFSYFPGFISEVEEQQLLQHITMVELHNFSFKGFVANRRIASFGYDYNFESGSLSKSSEIPEFFKPLINRVAKHLSIAATDFAELLVIEYPVGAVMNWHRDAPPFGIIAGISLLTDCTFKLRPQEKTKQTRSATISFPIHRRSLYVMEGEARTDWQHSVAPAKKVRYSITLRTLKGVL